MAHGGIWLTWIKGQPPARQRARIFGSVLVVPLAVVGCTPATTPSEQPSAATEPAEAPTSTPTEEAAYEVPEVAPGELVRRVIGPSSNKTVVSNDATPGVSYLVEVQCKTSTSGGQRVMVRVVAKKEERFEGAINCGQAPAAATLLEFSKGTVVQLEVTGSSEDVRGWARVVPANTK